MVDQQLMDYFKFDDADLYANQSGSFTDKQKVHIKQKDESSRKTGMGMGIVLIAVGLCGLGGAIFAVLNDSDWGFRIGFGLGFGVIWPLVWGGIGWMMMSDSFTKHDFKLARVQGRANLVAHESYSSSSHTTTISHELHIGGQEFTVEEDAANVIMQGEEYIIYYVDSTHEIMSVEHA